MTAAPLAGVLLAAGRGARYDPSGQRLKLLAPALSGEHAGAPLAVAAARTLHTVLPRVIAVVRAGTGAQAELQQQLRAAGCELCVREHADDGIGASLAAGVRASADAGGWIVALADMPAVRHSTVRAIVAALRAGAITAAPMHDGRRGHPVGFAACLREELLALDGDIGARSVLQRHPPHTVLTDDPGVLLDIDLPEAR